MKRSDIDPNNQWAAIARKMKKYRVHRNMSVLDVASVMGVSKGVISKYENAKTSPGLDSFCRWCDAVGIKINLIPVEKTVSHAKDN